MSEQLPLLPERKALGLGDVLALALQEHHDGKGDHADHGRKQAAGEQSCDRDAVTEPTVISTMLGGIVSDMTAEAESSDVRFPSLLPRLIISGKSAGATAAMSAAFAPEMPETRYIAPSSAYCSRRADGR